MSVVPFPVTAAIEQARADARWRAVKEFVAEPVNESNPIRQRAKATVDMLESIRARSLVPPEPRGPGLLDAI